MQLVGERVVLLDTMKDRRIGVPEVIEKFGVTPDKVVEVQSLAGDSVDNVPGVPGIGLKTAAQLVLEYGDLESLLAGAPGIKQQKRRENLIAFAEQARISHRLVTLKRDVPLEHSIDTLGVRPIIGEQLIAYAKAMEFSTIIRRAAEATGVEPSKVAPAVVPVTYWPPEGEASSSPDGSGRYANGKRIAHFLLLSDRERGRERPILPGEGFHAWQPRGRGARPDASDSGRPLGL